MHHQTKCRESREKKCQAEGVPRTDAVNGRDSQAVRRRSYRLSLFFIAFHSFRNFHRPACPGSIGMIYSFTFIHRLVCDSGPFLFPSCNECHMGHGASNAGQPVSISAQQRLQRKLCFPCPPSEQAPNDTMINGHATCPITKRLWEISDLENHIRTYNNTKMQNCLHRTTGHKQFK